MASEKQEQVNARNAQLSSGPISPEGKAVVSRNAVKHGIFAKDLVINAGDGREDALEYHNLLAELVKDLVPVGRMEMLLVEKIAVNYWRLRRLVRYETGEIRVRLDDFRNTALQSYYSSSYNSRQRPELKYYSYNDEIPDTEYQEQLYKVASMMNSDFNLAEDKAALEYVLYARLDREETEFCDKDYKAAKKYVAGLSPQLLGKLRKEMLEEAEQMLVEMDEVRSWSVKFDRIQKSKSLPEALNLVKIIKYENSLERSIFRNLAALKTLQEHRAKTCNPNDDLLELPASGG
ncbi:MAG: hypothetical protein A2521_09450 [Deltaproteobacteria bacterium RIFOXYD12_FULL_57_12]|nr:MAG: hypothetical protein A2521_09450 [Deltaproteobacteria bacterium RIFOXYD12_FULL_57_12]